MVRLVLHGLGQPGMGLLLIGVLGLVVLLSGIGLIGLFAHGPLPTRPIARQTPTGQRAAAGQDGREVNGGSVWTGSPQSTLARGVIIGSRTVQAPAGWVMLAQIEIGNEDASRC